MTDKAKKPEDPLTIFSIASFLETDEFRSAQDEIRDAVRAAEVRYVIQYDQDRMLAQHHNMIMGKALPLVGSHAIHMSMSVEGAFDYGRRSPAPARYQYTEKFSKEVKDKAWKLLEQHMSPEQYFAFMEKADIELENVAGDFRLIINRSGEFTILEGARGKGIVAQSGNVRSYRYPLGDEIAAFIDWFNHRTRDLIAQWSCGTYGIVRDGERR